MDIVTIGGGNGQSRLLKALLARRCIEIQITAIPAVSDSGKSTGRLRPISGIAVGDIRRCLTALAKDVTLANLWEHRFDGRSAPIDGHLGNFNLAALFSNYGPKQGLAIAHKMLKCEGRVIPPTFSSVELVAETTRGRLLTNQWEVSRRPEPEERIEQFALRPCDPELKWIEPNPDALTAIAAADLIVIGPGALFSSILAALAVPGITAAVSRASAQKLFVCNLASDLPETAGFTPADFVATLLRFSPVKLDGVIYDSSQTAVYGGLSAYADTIASMEDRRHHDGRTLARLLLELFNRKGVR